MLIYWLYNQPLSRSAQVCLFLHNVIYCEVIALWNVMQCVCCVGGVVYYVYLYLKLIIECVWIGTILVLSFLSIYRLSHIGWEYIVYRVWSAAHMYTMIVFLSDQIVYLTCGRDNLQHWPRIPRPEIRIIYKSNAIPITHLFRWCCWLWWFWQVNRRM